MSLPNYMGLPGSRRDGSYGFGRQYGEFQSAQHIGPLEGYSTSCGDHLRLNSLNRPFPDLHGNMGPGSLGGLGGIDPPPFGPKY